MDVSISFTEGDAKMEVHLLGDKMIIRRPSKKSPSLDLLAKGLLEDLGEEAEGAKEFLEQGKDLSVALGEERCG